jgi:hypothetical protein
MNTKKITFGLAALLLAGSTLFTSCKKKTSSEDSDTSSASDNSMAQQHYNDLNSMADEVLKNGTETTYKTINPYGVMSSCAVVDLASGTKVNYATDGKDTVTVNFGATNCLCNDGRYRRGIVTFVYNGTYLTVGTVITVTTSNYFVNDNQVMGTKTITTLTPAAGTNASHSIVVAGTIIKASGGGTITWNSTRQRDWVSGDMTSMWNDDVYHITGNANGTSSGGSSFTGNITSPLVREFSLTNPACKKYFVQGTLTFTPSGKAMRTVDFGTGACDNVATVTINGHTYTITLP